MSEIFLPTDEMLKNGSAEDIANILISTNKKNAPLREELLSRFSPTIRSADREFSFENDKKLTLLSKLYNTIDLDKNAKSFVKKSLPKIDGNMQLDDFVDILENVSTKKLNIFKDNAWNIIFKTSKEERIDALNNNITDAFFETESSRISNKLKIQYGYIKKPSITKNLYMKVKNGINILRDLITPTNEASKVKSTIPQEKALPKEAFKPEIKTEPETKAVPQIEPKTQVVPNSTPAKKTAKKQIVKDKVVEFVKTKLGEKTFNSQQEKFSKNATKIRMSLLPEIFASIADTRKMDRMIGKTRNQSSNKDVLTLYSKINGHNRKFVNYMLKKRNVDNSRMFEVRDIIAILEKAESKIADNKRLNLNYRAKDAKAYYNHLFDAKIEQYGKLKRAKTK